MEAYTIVSCYQWFALVVLFNFIFILPIDIFNYFRRSGTV